MMMAPMASKRTLYDILGVPRDATAIDVGLAYERHKSQALNAVPQDTSTLALLHQANEVLSNPKRRAAYDASLAAASEKAAAAARAEAQAEAQPLEVVVEEHAEPERKLPWIALAAVGVVVLVALVIGLGRRHAETAPKIEPVAEAPKPLPPAPRPRTSAQILAAALPSVARLQSFEMSGRAVPVGLALAIEPGIMVTTCHGIPAGVQLVATVGAESHSAALAVTDEDLDLCKLSLAGYGGRQLPIAAEEPKVGDTVYALGANATGEYALTEGKVKQIRKAPPGNVIEISIPIAPTASGGAVFDTFGNLLGIGTTPHSYGPGLNVALPASWIIQIRSRGKQ
jgi:S1-C subfamily serine protease